MSLCSFSGSEDSRGLEYTYYNLGASKFQNALDNPKLLQHPLENIQREQRHRTPDFGRPDSPPTPAKNKCIQLCMSLLDKERLDEARKSNSSGWYQLYMALAMIQLLMSKAEEKGIWSNTSALFGDGSTSHEEPELSHSYWRDLADSVCRILVEKMGATNDEIRHHLQQSIGRDAFWELELNVLRHVVADELDEFQDHMTKRWEQPRSEHPSPHQSTTQRATPQQTTRQATPQQTTQQATPQQTTPQALKARQPGKVGKTAAKRGKKTRLGRRKNRGNLRTTTTRANEAPSTTREVPGNSFASTAVTRELSGIAYGLSLDNIIEKDANDHDNDKRVLRKRANPKTNKSRNN